MDNKKISVVVPVYFSSDKNRKESDANILRAIALADMNAEWIVVETETSYYQDLVDIHIYEKEKSTPNESVNRGFNVASGNFVVFLANDVAVCEQWLSLLYSCFVKYADCGLATLGNNEHADVVFNDFKEGSPFFFSLCMLRKKDAWLDPQYTYSFDDTDLIFRLYLNGEKVYKNLNGYVEHKKHTTYGHFCGNKEEYEKCRKIFLNKYKKYADLPLYKLLGGVQ